MRDRERRKQRNEEERCKPGWKMREKRREGKQNRAEDRKALEDGRLPILSWTSPWEG